jgi:hypothetical protein
MQVKVEDVDSKPAKGGKKLHKDEVESISVDSEAEQLVLSS